MTVKVTFELLKNAALSMEVMLAGMVTNVREELPENVFEITGGIHGGFFFGKGEGEKV